MPDKPLDGRTVLLGVTGSIAACKAVELAGLLVKAGAEVPVVMTAAAQEFVRPLSFQAITHQPVYTGMFAEHAAEPRHIALAERAELLLVAPATANAIAKLALGIADELLYAVGMATRAPILLAPAMNDGMYTHPATRKNLAALLERGARTVGPEEGRLASGKVAIGRMSPPAAIFDSAVEALNGPRSDVC